MTQVETHNAVGKVNESAEMWVKLHNLRQTVGNVQWFYSNRSLISCEYPRGLYMMYSVQTILKNSNTLHNGIKVDEQEKTYHLSDYRNTVITIF